MQYNCFKCGKRVNSRSGIVLVGECQGNRTLFWFDTRPGQFDYEVTEDLKVAPGTVWEFHCPVCGANLTTDFNKRLARLELVDGDSIKRILFSKVASEQATFVLGGDELEAHGRDSISYLPESE